MPFDINAIVNQIEAADADDLGIEDIEDYSAISVDEDEIECKRGGFYTMRRDPDDFSDYSAYSFDDR